MRDLTMTLIGGPTVLIEAGGFRLLTDPTFDAPGTYALSYTTLTKTVGPALDAHAVGAIDTVLLSHDQHSDNLDKLGRSFLPEAGRVLTTVAGAGRLRGNAEGVAPWESKELRKPDGRSVRISATPARHGPTGIEPLSGDVTGFVLSFSERHVPSIYITGDTVWYSGLAEVAHRFQPRVVLPFAGAAQTRGPFRLTMDSNDVVELAANFPNALIVPVHAEGWAHLTQGRDDLDHTFAALGLASRLRLLEPGRATAIFD